MPANPIREARLMLDQSLHEFAQSCSVSRVAVQRAEAGCYIAVPPSIVNYLSGQLLVLPDETPLTTDVEIQTAYKTYQFLTRRDTYLDQVLSSGVTFPVGVSPVVYWRLTSGVSSQLEFCKLLCVHPYVINKLESGVQHKLPKQLLAAMREAGYDDEMIETLSKAQALYAER